MTSDSAYSAQDRKRAMRLEIRQHLGDMPPEERAEASREACALLQQQEFWRRADTILFYAPMEPELDIWPLLGLALAAGKHACLPRFTDTGEYEACGLADLTVDIVPGHFGIREGANHCPRVALNRLDLALVPGVAFDLQGRRLGRGKGFYDRLLPAVRGTRCGVGFDVQLVPEVPVETHDVLLNCILTPSRCIEL